MLAFYGRNQFMHVCMHAWPYKSWFESSLYALPLLFSVPPKAFSYTFKKKFEILPLPSG